MKNEKMHNSTFWLTIQSLIVSQGCFFMGYQLSILNTLYHPLQQILRTQFHFKKQQNLEIFIGYLTIVLPLGAIVGTIISQQQINKIGRRMMLIISDIVGIVGIILFIQQEWIYLELLLLSRLMIGISIGISSVVCPMYIIELSPNKLIGTLGSLVPISTACGILTSFSMSLFLDLNSITHNSLRHNQFIFNLILSASLINVFLRCFSLLLIYQLDTPQYYLHQQKPQLVYKVIQSIYQPEYVEQVYESVQQDYETLKFKTHSDLQQPLISNNHNPSKYSKFKLSIGCLLMFFQVFNGHKALIFYSQNILISQHESLSQAQLFTFIMGSILLGSSLLSGILLDKLGRKQLIIKGQLLCSIALLMLFLFSELQMTFMVKYLMLVFVFLFNSSIGSVLTTYLAEILDSQQLSICVFVYWISTMLVGFIYPLIKHTFKISAVFFFFWTFSFSSFLFDCLFIIETKFKSKHEIETEFYSLFVKISALVNSLKLGNKQ